MSDFKPTPYRVALKAAFKNAFTVPILDSFERRELRQALTCVWYFIVCVLVRIAILMTLPVSVPVLVLLIQKDERIRHEKAEKWKADMKARGNIWERNE